MSDAGDSANGAAADPSAVVNDSAGVDDAGCTVLHVDMDAFYASVEIRRRPQLRGRPVVVGGGGPRGVVSSASYAARAFGVRSAMPGALARRLCPAAVFLPPDFTAYTEASRAIMAIFRDVTPVVEPLSLDEAFLDVAGARRLLGGPVRIAEAIRTRIRSEQQLPCSVGAAPTKFMAKLGSARAKPDGLHVIPADQVLDYLHPLPVSVIWGVGERTGKLLRGLGLETVGDLAQAPVGMLRSAVGEAAAVHLHELSWGRDPRRVNPNGAEKSIGSETTFDTDVRDQAQLRRVFLGLATAVAGRLRQAELAGRTVAIKVRFADFRTVNRSRTLAGPTDVGREIYQIAVELLTALAPAEPIRLIGVRVEGLTQAGGGPRQLIIGEREHGWSDAERAADAVAARFSTGLVRPASLLAESNRSDHNGGRPALP